MTSSRGPAEQPGGEEGGTGADLLAAALGARELLPADLAGRLRRRGRDVRARTVRSWLEGVRPSREDASLTDELLAQHGRLYERWWPVDDAPAGRGERIAAPVPERPAGRWARVSVPLPALAGVGALVLLAAATAVILVVTDGGHHGPPEAISGTATCRDGDSIEGVYIHAADGGSAFAHTLGAGATKHFSLVLPHGGPWSANVGCGGTPAHWLHSPMGLGTVTTAEASWTCVTADMDRGREYCTATDGGGSG